MVLFELEEGFFFEKMKDFFFEEFFGMVIKVEIGVRKFYESFVERIDIQEFKEKIEWFVGEEKKYEEFLRKIYVNMFFGKEVVFFKEYIGLEFQFVVRKFNGVQDIIDFICWVMKVEEIVVQFYVKFEEMVDIEEKKRFMCYFSDMEWGYYYNLKVEYEFFFDWEMYGQMMYVGF